MNDIYILDPVYVGGTFYGARFELIDEVEVDGVIADVPVDLTGCDIIMSLVNALGRVIKTYSTSEGTLQIDSNAIILPEHVVSIPYGAYDFDFNIKSMSGEVIPGFASGKWTILKPKTIRP
jgi:hypothetical protein